MESLVLLRMANHLDSVGLHREADILDKVLEKQAQLLAFKEKPFLAQLAKIVLSVKSKKSGERISDADLRFPISNRRLVGLNKQEVLEEIHKHLTAFIEQFLIPNLEKRYRGTRYENEYKRFIDGVRELADLIKASFVAKSVQQNIREALTAIDQVKRMLGKLIVYERTREGKVPAQPAEDKFKEALNVLGDLEVAVQRLDEAEAERKIAELKQVIPYNAGIRDSVVFIVTEAYNRGLLPFVRARDVQELASDAMSADQAVEYNKLKSHKKRLEVELKRKQDLIGQVGVLEDTLRQIANEASQYEGQLGSLDRQQHKELYQLLESEVEQQYLVPTSYEQYRSKYRMYERIEHDIARLGRFFEKYKKNSELAKTISFSTFLSRGQGPRRFAEVLRAIQNNLKILTSELLYEEQAVDTGLVNVTNQITPLEEEEYAAKLRAIWTLWYENFINRLSQTIQFTMAPETRGEETSEQVYKRVLLEFGRLLQYEL